VKPAYLGQNEVAVQGIPLERRPRVLGGLDASLRLKRWVSATLLEEVTEGGIEMAEGLLLGNTTDFVKPEEVLVFLEVSEESGRLVIADLLAFAVGVRASPEAPVVDETDAPKGLGKDLLLVERRVKSKLVAYLHTPIIAHVTRESQYSNERKEEAVIPPPAEAGGLLAA
jgi:hypothetical protein